MGITADGSRTGQPVLQQRPVSFRWTQHWRVGQAVQHATYSMIKGHRVMPFGTVHWRRAGRTGSAKRDPKILPRRTVPDRSCRREHVSRGSERPLPHIRIRLVQQILSHVLVSAPLFAAFLSPIESQARTLIHGTANTVLEWTSWRLLRTEENSLISTMRSALCTLHPLVYSTCHSNTCKHKGQTRIMDERHPVPTCKSRRCCAPRRFILRLFLGGRGDGRAGCMHA